jgi:hypothetical protein
MGELIRRFTSDTCIESWDLGRGDRIYRDVLGFEVKQRYGSQARFVRGRLPPSHWARILGKASEGLAAATRNHRPLPSCNSVSNEGPGAGLMHCGAIISLHKHLLST